MNIWNRTLSLILIMYIYHALINALSAHTIHINLNMIFFHTDITVKADLAQKPIIYLSIQTASVVYMSTCYECYTFGVISIATVSLNLPVLAALSKYVNTCARFWAYSYISMKYADIERKKSTWNMVHKLYQATHTHTLTHTCCQRIYESATVQHRPFHAGCRHNT